MLPQDLKARAELQAREEGLSLGALVTTSHVLDEVFTLLGRCAGNAFAVERAFSFDRHFALAGFELWPES